MTEGDYLDEDQAEAAQQTLDNLEEIRADFHGAFDTPHGQNALLSIRHFCRGAASSYVERPDGLAAALRMSFNEGKRAVYLMITEHLQMEDTEIIERARNAAARRL